jgi:hypothetical protein
MVMSDFLFLCVRLPELFLRYVFFFFPLLPPADLDILDGTLTAGIMVAAVLVDSEGVRLAA